MASTGVRSRGDASGTGGGSGRGSEAGGSGLGSGPGGSGVGSGRGFASTSGSGSLGGSGRSCGGSCVVGSVRHSRVGWGSWVSGEVDSVGFISAFVHVPCRHVPFAPHSASVIHCSEKGGRDGNARHDTSN